MAKKALRPEVYRKVYSRNLKIIEVNNTIVVKIQRKSDLHLKGILIFKKMEDGTHNTNRIFLIAGNYHFIKTYMVYVPFQWMRVQ